MSLAVVAQPGGRANRLVAVLGHFIQQLNPLMNERTMWMIDVLDDNRPHPPFIVPYRDSPGWRTLRVLLLRWAEVLADTSALPPGLMRVVAHIGFIVICKVRDRAEVSALPRLAGRLQGLVPLVGGTLDIDAPVWDVLLDAAEGFSGALADFFLDVPGLLVIAMAYRILESSQFTLADALQRASHAVATGFFGILRYTSPTELLPAVAPRVSASRPSSPDPMDIDEEDEAGLTSSMSDVDDACIEEYEDRVVVVDYATDDSTQSSHRKRPFEDDDDSEDDEAEVAALCLEDDTNDDNSAADDHGLRDLISLQHRALAAFSAADAEPGLALQLCKEVIRGQPGFKSQTFQAQSIVQNIVRHAVGFIGCYVYKIGEGCHAGSKEDVGLALTLHGELQLARYYQTSDGRDLASAVESFTNALERRYFEAYLYLGFAREATAPESAMKDYRNGADREQVLCMLRLSDVYRLGLLGQPSSGKNGAFWLKAAEVENPDTVEAVELYAALLESASPMFLENVIPRGSTPDIELEKYRVKAKEVRKRLGTVKEQGASGQPPIKRRRIRYDEEAEPFTLRS